MNFYCWDLIIYNIIFYKYLDAPLPPLPPRISLKFGGGLHTSPLCVSPLPRPRVPETWGNIVFKFDVVWEDCIQEETRVANREALLKEDDQALATHVRFVVTP